MDELLKQALKKYPVGTRIKSNGTGLVSTCGYHAFINYVGDICIRQQGVDSNLGAIRVYSTSIKKWADIV